MASSSRESRFILDYFWKYRSTIGSGVLALVVVNVVGILPPLIVKELIDGLANRLPLSTLGWYCAGYFALQLVMAFCRYYWRVYLLLGSTFVEDDVRKRLIKSTTSFPFSKFHQQDPGHVIALVSNDTQAIRRVYDGGMIVFFDSFLYLMLAPIAMYWLSPKLTLWALLPIPLIPVLVLKRQTLIKFRYSKVQKQLGRLMGLSREALDGLRHIRSSATEDTLIQHFEAEGRQYVNRSVELARLETILPPLLELVVGVSILIALFVGGKMVMADTLSVGALVAFTQYLRQIRWPAQAVGVAAAIYQRGSGSAQRILDYLGEDEVGDRKLAKGVSDEVAQVGGEQGLQVRRLNFAFDQKRTILSSLDLTISKGEMVAVVGEVGAGKTVLLEVLAGLRPASSGVVQLDGREVSEFSNQERAEAISLVPQDAEVFHSSIAENIAAGREFETEAKAQQELNECCAAACCLEEFTNMPQGFFTILGEKGVRLSGGQRQRLSIARALYAKTPYLFLDDSLSAVDTATEQKLLSSLRALPLDTTVLMTAHRLSTAIAADRIIVLQEGRVTGVGSHQELLASGHVWYQKFCEAQGAQ
jgi:ATP-binding cassette, subfamily B, multidrug efflux pump